MYIYLKINIFLKLIKTTKLKILNKIIIKLIEMEKETKLIWID